MYHAILVCAGDGTRVREATGYLPKCLISLNGKPALIRQIEWLENQPMPPCEIRIAIKAKHRLVVEGCLRNWHKKAKLVLCPNQAEGSLAAVRYAASDLQGQQCYVQWSDLLMPHNLKLRLGHDTTICSTEELRYNWSEGEILSDEQGKGVLGAWLFTKLPYLGEIADIDKPDFCDALQSWHSGCYICDDVLDFGRSLDGIKLTNDKLIQQEGKARTRDVRLVFDGDVVAKYTASLMREVSWLTLAKNVGINVVNVLSFDCERECYAMQREIAPSFAELLSAKLCEPEDVYKAISRELNKLPMLNKSHYSARNASIGKCVQRYADAKLLDAEIWQMLDKLIGKCWPIIEQDAISQPLFAVHGDAMPSNAFMRYSPDEYGELSLHAILFDPGATSVSTKACEYAKLCYGFGYWHMLSEHGVIQNLCEEYWMLCRSKAELAWLCIHCFAGIPLLAKEPCKLLLGRQAMRHDVEQMLALL